MPKARSGHLIIGIALVVMGYALLVIALSRQAERIQGHAQLMASASGPTRVAGELPNGSEVPAAALPRAVGPPGGEDASATGSVELEGGAADAPQDAGERSDGGEGDARLFRFYPGGAAMSREEVQRLSSYGKLVARHPTATVTLEGCGDTAGTDTLNAGIAKHRLKVVTTLLVRAGLADERITAVPVDVATDPRLARLVRATTSVPLSELEKP